MNIRAVLLAGFLASPLPTAGAFAADGADTLIAAVSRNDMNAADELLKAGADPKAANDLGATPLYAAAQNADPAMAKRLLAAGADANAALLSGETPLMAAATRGNLATAQALLAGGANANARETGAGQTALMWAISEQHGDVEAALVKGGADIDARSKKGGTALMMAAQQTDPSFAKVLLDAGANPNDAMAKTKLTPLIIASAMGHAEVAALLLDKGADPNAVDDKGFTPLHHAARDKRALKIVKALLAHGAKPNIRMVQQKPATFTTTMIEMRGATPLVVAAEINNFDAVKALVEAGADPLIPTETNTTALMLAAGAGTDVVRPRNAKERATAIETVKFLVDHGGDVNGVGQFGWTPLHAAAYQGLDDVIQYLVDKGGDLNVMDKFGQTPLSIADTVLTPQIGAATLQIPRIYRRATIELIQKLGATPLEQSGVQILFQRNAG